MTILELCSLLKKKIAFVVVISLVGCLAGIGMGFALLTGTYSSTTSMYVGLSQSIPVISEDGSVIEKYKSYLSDTTTNMVTDVATLANNKQVIDEAAATAGISNPGDYSVTPTVAKTSHVITLTVTGPNEDVQKLANQLPLVLQERATNILLLDDIQQIDTASEPNLSGTTKNRILYAVIGLVFGLLISAFIVVLQDMIKPRIKNGLEMETGFELPVLGDVSDMAATGRLKTVLAERCKEDGGTKVGIAAVSGQDATTVVSQLSDGKSNDEVSIIELPTLIDSADSISKAVEAKNVALVVRPYVTLRKDVATAIDQLHLAGVIIMGFIVVD